MAGPPGKRAHAFLSEDEKQNRPEISRELITRIGRYLIPYWKQILLVLGTMLIQAILGVVPAILTGKIIDEGLIDQDLNKLVTYIVIALAAITAVNLIGILESYLNSWISQHITFDLRNKLFAHLQSMSHRFYTTNKQGDIITRMTSDISGVQSVIANTFTSVLSNVIVLIVALIAMYQLNWILATVALIIVPLFRIPTMRVGKTRWQLTQQSQECNDGINSILNETLSVSGQLLVKLFTNEQSEYRKYHDHNYKMMGLNIKEGLAGRWFRATMSIFINIGPMLIYLVGGIIIIKYAGELSVGDITVMVALLSRMYQPINALLNIQVDVIRSMAMFTRIFEYLDLPAEIKNCVDPVIPATIHGDISFRDVHFHYNQEKPILNGINFDLSPQKSIALVGSSGAGKSTIINLIPRLYDVTAGEICCDGVDIRHIDLHCLRDNIGMVTQDTYLFNGTIKENLLYAKFDATEKEVIEACKKANLHHFIIEQPQGYDTMVGNRGLKLSGGEKQRLSIARVILKNPTILIFDEATSALDSISEKLIQDAIDPLIQQKTSIVIAHRLSTIKAVDEIIVIDKGSIAERGPHSQLIKQGGLYSTLYETQFKETGEGSQRMGK